MSAFEAFVTVHQYQLAAIPQDLWLPLFMKLGEDYLDAGKIQGNYVELHYGDPLEGYSLHLKADQSMAKNSEIFLVDHAWTTTPETARKELLGNPKLLERLEGMMDIEKDDEPELSDAEEEEIEHDDDAIQTVAEQADVSLDEAKKALEEEKYEVVNAIMRLTFSEDFKKESDRLQEQVMGQLIASGKAQEKEDKVKKEKEERLKKRHEAWMNDRVNSVCRHMWSYLQTYSYSILQQDGQPTTQTAWYMNDEVGSALAHASDPNMVCIPFIFSRGASGMIPYSVMFPIKDINAGEILTCDLVPKKLERPLDRAAYLLAFESRTVREERRVHDEELIEAYKLEQKHFIPDVQTAQPSEQASADGVVHVYSTTQYVRDHLKLAGAKFTGSPDSADLLWYSQDFEEWDKLKPGQTINQYRYESCLTQKQHLADLIQDTWGSPSWMPNTYNLTTQLAEFVGNYLANSKSSEPNLWITKPWNFARGIEIDVDDDLAYLIRQHDSPTPKIVQQYITKPSLYNHKKYDLRYIVLVRPGGTVCIYKMFWVRLANKRFNLKDLKDYECQFTVMNYSKFPMTQLDYKSFIHNFEKQHQTQWDPIQKEVDHAIRCK
ncbi:tubulin-tyrosine ligase family-domain-containing protein [Dichotomocladium elegans]|nr:tubulin-tyrosine ligase family-domain-containing protein [Dichotomocladium elegans]